jgi:transcriptional regulator of acetoin/glycerol metabolism
MRRRWTLIVVDGDDRGNQAEIEDAPALIGAAPAATLVLTDDTVSRYHAEIDVFADAIRIRDLDSTNGTFTEAGARVREALVENGGTFRVGQTVVRIVAIDEPAGSEIPTDPTLQAPGTVLEIGNALAASPSTFVLFDDIRRVAISTSSVLFRGERGSGRATLARVLYTLSPRARSPFFAVDAADLRPEDYHRAFLRAHRGTLLIEDVEKLQPEVQAALRHTLERGEVRPHGDDKTLRVDVRVLSSTSIDLAKSPTFDPVLLRRIGVVQLVVPPLSERIDDAIAISNRALAPRGLRVGPRVTALLRLHRWTRHVEELEAMLKDPLADGPLVGPLLDDTVAELEGDVSRAAEKLSVSTGALFRRLAHYDVDIDAP